MKKKSKKFAIKQEYINIPKFLSRYLDIDIVDNYDSYKKMTHFELKKFNIEGVTALPFDIVDSDSVAIGKIIIVEDSKGHIAPYKNPKYIQPSKLR